MPFESFANAGEAVTAGRAPRQMNGRASYCMAALYGLSFSEDPYLPLII